MTEVEAIIFGYNLLQTVELTQWDIEISDRSQSRLGLCHYTDKKIVLSQWMFERAPLQVQDTVAHEVAHAIVGPGYRHGEKWKKVAVLLGAKPTACADLPLSMLPDRKWETYCPKCSQVTRRTLKQRPSVTRGRKTCLKCSVVLKQRPYRK